MANTKITTAVIKDDAITTAKIADDAVTGALIADDVALAGNPTTTTQSAGNSTTRIATTAFVTTAINNLVDSAPSALDTLNELAAAMGDDANFSTTVTNSIATKLPLAGGTMTGDLNMGSQDITNAGSVTADSAVIDGDLTFDPGGDRSIIGPTNSSLKILANPNATNEGIIFSTDNGTTTEVFIQDGGNVGIGTTNTYNMRATIAGAGSALSTGTGSYAVASIYDTATAAVGTGGGLAFQGDDGTNSAVTFATINGSKENSTSGNYASFLSFHTRANAGNVTEQMRIDSSGNLLVGTTNANPTSSSVNDAGVELSNTGGVRSTVASNPAATFNRKTDDGHIVLFRKNGGSVAVIGVENGDNAYVGGTASGHGGFYFGNTNVAPMAAGTRADDTVSLGTSTYRWEDLYLSGDLIAGGGGTSATGEIQFVADSTRARIVGGYDSGGGGYIAFRTDTAGGTDLERARFNNAGNLAFTSGNGIDFSATGDGSGSMSSELLDDYEEGTWTPTDESGAGLSFTVSHNRYTKIGRVVHAHVLLTYPTTSNTSLAKIGIPFTANANSDASATGGAVTEQNIDNTKSYTASVNYLSSLVIRERGSRALYNNELSGKNLRFTVTYFT